MKMDVYVITYNVEGHDLLSFVRLILQDLFYIMILTKITTFNIGTLTLTPERYLCMGTGLN